MDGSGNTEAGTLHLETMAAAVLGVPAAAGAVPGHVTCVLKAYRWPPCPLHLSRPACPSEMTFPKLLWRVLTCGKPPLVSLLPARERPDSAAWH